MKIKFLPFVLVFSWMFFSCSDDDLNIKTEEEQEQEPEDKASEDTIALNKWIYDVMDEVYLWTDHLPSESNVDFKQEEVPQAFFYDLVYGQKDFWSSITDDYASLEADLRGVPVTMGYSMVPFQVASNDRVFFVVEYVYNGSDADSAGIERGDIIVSIDDTQLNPDNYFELYSRDSYSVQLGAFKDGTVSSTGESVDLTARVTSADPAVHYEIIEKDDKKIGYLVYVKFVTGEDNKFLDNLDAIFEEFKSNDITDLVVDLRNNPGGDILAARHLASAIGPADIVADEKVLVNMEYNNLYQYFFEENKDEYRDNLAYRFKTGTINLDLDQVFFLTTSNSASASELVVTGLDPYIDVVQIGEATYGKYVGSWVIPDDSEQWAMMPIVFKYVNSNGYTDFGDGLPPDHQIEQDVDTYVPFGDPEDAMLGKAISLITGQEETSETEKKSGSRISVTQLETKEMIRARKLLVPFDQDRMKD